MIFTTAFSVLFPLFGKLALGYGLRRIKLLNGITLREMNNAVFRVFLPALLFVNIYHTDFASIKSFTLLWYAVVALAGIVTLFMVVIPLVVQGNPQRGVLVQGITRSNFILFGIPMAAALFGGESAGIASIMAGIVVPLLNMTSVIALEYFRGKKPDMVKMLEEIVRNPIIIGGALGFLFALTGIRIPLLLDKLLMEIASIATPLALIVLGGSVTYSTVKINMKPLVIGVVSRLIVVPMIGLGISVLLGFRGLELILLLAMFASPTAVSTYPMAQQMDGDAELAGQLVVFTTSLSLISLFFWISGMMALGLF